MWHTKLWSFQNCSQLTSPRRNKELCPVRDFSPSMLLYGAPSLLRTNFLRCDALLCFVASSLASPIAYGTEISIWKSCTQTIVCNNVTIVCDNVKLCVTMWNCVWQCEIVCDNVTIVCDNVKLCVTMLQLCVTMWNCVWQCYNCVWQCEIVCDNVTIVCDNVLAVWKFILTRVIRDWCTDTSAPEP